MRFRGIMGSYTVRGKGERGKGVREANASKNIQGAHVFILVRGGKSPGAQVPHGGALD